MRSLSIAVLVMTLLLSCNRVVSNGIEPVYLNVGDNFNDANTFYPPGTTFIIGSGTHTEQWVENPVKGNSWVGENGAVMDGRNKISAAFFGVATDLILKNIEISNYGDNGIYFKSGKQISLEQIRVSDTGSGSGEVNGAIRIDNATDVTVSESRFTRVSSGILLTRVKSPITVEHNYGLNIGRNFLQCSYCRGGNIRVQYNVMERAGDYLRPGAEDVEDWISVFETHGLEGDPARFNFNKARGHGFSDSGSFIMLGDNGGSYLEAVGNIGITPGQAGIGIAGGHHIEVRNNILYNKPWKDSNVAISSFDYSPGNCGPHRVINNRANWRNNNKRPNPNNFWTDEKCGLSYSDIVTFNKYDQTLSEDIWNTFIPGMESMAVDQTVK